MVSSALKATSDVGNTIHRGIRLPVMEVAGVVNGLKAALDVLVGRSPSGATTSRSYSSGSKPGPVPVKTESAATRYEMSTFDPSSAVPASPGAEAVVEKFRRENL